MLIEARFGALSRGTERLVFAGRVPSSEIERMRAPMQVGEFSFPVKYGYTSVGRVLEGPPELVGRHVFCLAPHQTVYWAPSAFVTLLPADLPAERAVLAANMETALNGVWDAEIKAGDRVAVVGAGVVGCLVAFLCARHPGVEASLVDVDARKSAVASAIGVRFVAPDDIRGAQADVVLHASGSAAGLITALAAAGQETRVVELSWFGDATPALPLGGAFHARRVTLRSSQVGSLPPSQRARWTHRRRMEMALALLAAPELGALINSESSFDALPEVLPRVLGATSDVLCHRIRYT